MQSSDIMAATADALLAGVGRKTISPPNGIPHAGWGAQTHKFSEGNALDLWVTALALQRGNTRVMILDVDVGVILSPRADEIRALIAETTGVHRQNIRLSYTHTHAGVVPSGFVRLGREEMVAAYYELVKWHCVAAAQEAIARMEPANVAVGEGECAITVNRRLRLGDGRLVVGPNPAGPTDHRVIAVRIDRYDETPLACIMTYGSHPIVLGHENRLISPDFPGVSKRVVESVFQAPCLFLQGCAGDQMPLHAFTADVTVCRRLGTRLGVEALSILSALRTVDAHLEPDGIVESGAPLAVYREVIRPQAPPVLTAATRMISLPLRPGLLPVADAERDFAREKDVLGSIMRDSPDAKDAIAAAMYRVKRSEIALAWSRRLGNRTELEVELQGIRIGPLGLVAFPGEPFAEYGMRLSKLSPLKFTHLAGYTNGHAGYVPTPDAFEEGGYEIELGCRFTAGVGEILIRECVALIEELVNT